MIQELLQLALREAEKAGVYAICRYQSVQEFSIVVNNGQTERIVNEESEGLGVQVFSPEGYAGFASTDNPDRVSAVELVDRAAQLAKLSMRFRGETNKAVFSAPYVLLDVPSPQIYPFNKLSLDQAEEKVKQENSHLGAGLPALSVQSVYRQVQERWQIVRSDGSACSFEMPRGVFAHTFTARDKEKTVSTRSAMGGTDISLLLHQDKLEEGRARAKVMAKLAQDLLAAPRVKGGSYKLVIDYALAKGLAHEAFGHAVETDAIRTSVLGEKGKLAVGREVADSRVSIVDGPLPGDWAYQPVSANAIPRETVTIVDKGKLVAGLGDLFSAAQAGVPMSGAERAESYAHIPLPRMTNIRIQVEQPVPLDKTWYETKPADIYRLLLANGLAAPGEEIYYLSGYKGGQVNTQYGDFVFNCSAIYKLGEEPVLFQPGIFTGKTLSALRAIEAGIGPVISDAIGTCGKWGQGVPSSGGSHAFLLLRQDPEITIGGE